MVLAQLGGSISRALAQMSNATVIDEKVLGECLNEISRTLLQSDVRKIINLETLAIGTNKRRIIQQVLPAPPPSIHFLRYSIEGRACQGGLVGWRLMPLCFSCCRSS